MKVVVTGCNGYIGGVLVEKLLTEGYSVVGIDHRSETWQTFRHSGRYEFVQIELADRNCTDRAVAALTGTHAVFHLSSHQPFSWDPAPFVAGNVTRTANILEATRKSGVKRFILSSTYAVYGETDKVPLCESGPVNPRNIYEVTKYQAEMLTSTYTEIAGLSSSILRYSSVYGGRNRVGSLYYFIESTYKGSGVRLFAGGKTVKDYVYVDDVVAANIAALSLDGEGRCEVLNIGGGEPISTRDLVSLIFDLTGRSTPIEYVEDPHWRASDLYPDISKAGRLLNYHPLDMRAGIQLYLNTLSNEKTASLS